MNEETARAGIRVRKAEKAHNIRTFSLGRGAKKKGPNCIQIRVLLWQITLIWIQMHPTLLLGCISGQAGCIIDFCPKSDYNYSVRFRIFVLERQV